MAQGFSAVMAAALAGSVIPAPLIDGRLMGGRVRAYVAVLDLADANVKHANGDTNVLFDIPAGEKPLCYASVGSATMGPSATVAIGNSTTAGKYRAAAVHTNTTLSFAMLDTAIDDDPLTAVERVIMTWGTADGPASGKLIIVFFTVGR